VRRFGHITEVLRVVFPVWPEVEMSELLPVCLSAMVSGLVAPDPPLTGVGASIATSAGNSASGWDTT